MDGAENRPYSVGLRGGALSQKRAAVSCNVAVQPEQSERSHGAQQRQGFKELQVQEETLGGPRKAGRML